MQKEKKTGKKDASEVKCYNCGIVGHYANNCPHKFDKKKPADSEEEDDERLGHVIWADATTFYTYQVNSVSDNRFGRTEVLLDNAVDASIVHPSLLRNIMPAEKTIKINGVGGHQFTVTETGYLDPFFPVYASAHRHANILSFSQVEDKFPITYQAQDSFTVHLPHVDVVFKRRDGMYVADWAKYRNVFSTRVCTRAEEERARKAFELACMSGYPSVSELIHLVEDGNITGMPSLTREDLLRAYDLYGTPPAYVRGILTKRPISHVVIEENLMMIEKKQRLYADVMKYDGTMFLITICDPLHLLLSTPIERETANQLGLALQGSSMYYVVVDLSPLSCIRIPGLAFRNS